VTRLRRTIGCVPVGPGCLGQGKQHRPLGRKQRNRRAKSTAELTAGLAVCGRDEGQVRSPQPIRPGPAMTELGQISDQRLMLEGRACQAHGMVDGGRCVHEHAQHRQNADPPFRAHRPIEPRTSVLRHSNHPPSTGLNRPFRHPGAVRAPTGHARDQAGTRARCSERFWQSSYRNASGSGEEEAAWCCAYRQPRARGQVSGSRPGPARFACTRRPDDARERERPRNLLSPALPC
jgi:hypothetical protein